jgi:hypothetical protein
MRTFIRATPRSCGGDAPLSKHLAVDPGCPEPSGRVRHSTINTDTENLPKVQERILDHFFLNSAHNFTMSRTNPLEFKTLGFIGLGAMGKPMLTHLANKLPAESQIFVFDVAEAAVDEIVSQFPNRVFKASSAKNVAEQVVRTSNPSVKQLDPKLNIT